MKTIKLLSLTFRDFKGLRSFVLNAGGENVSAYGDNGTGKTTLFDGFTWLLFGKDSHNKSDFDIKTLDEANKVINGLEHEVEGVISIDGKKNTLRKVYAEKWTKKRGSALEEFSGHTTGYFIDGVPMKEKEFTEFVGGIINETVFKLLTNPFHFNEMHWKDRRKTILEVCGDISDAEVIAGNRKLEKLPAILEDRSLEGHRKMIDARRADINKEIDKIPVRIDEVRRSAPDISGLDEEFITDDLAAIRKKIEDKQEEMSRIQSGGEIAVKEKRIKEIESELIDIKNRFQSGAVDQANIKRSEISQKSSEIDAIKRDIDDKTQRIASKTKEAAQKEEMASNLRTKWTQVNNQVLEHTEADSCPACGQSLPEEKVQAAHAKALAAFNKQRAETLESISRDGKAATAEMNLLKAEIVELEAAIGPAKQSLTILESSLGALKAELEGMQDIPNASTQPEYLQKLDEIVKIKQEILELRSTNLGTLEAVRAEITKLRMTAEHLESDKAKFGLAKASEERIKDLMQQEKVLAAEFEKLEQEVFLSEEFIRTKVTMLESKINSKFKHARFKLFDQQINGGISETCQTLYKGVPYGSGLNNAAEINVGLDIISTLSEHYGFSAPIFVDNAEAVTKLIETKSQVIRLVVSEQDKQLRVEQMKLQEAI